MTTARKSRADAPGAGSKRARTRALLLDTATGLFRKKGISAVSLDEIAARAGLTKGSIYGNFRNKDDLVFAVTMERTSRAIPVFDAETPLPDQLRKHIRSHFRQRGNGRRDYAFLAEIDLYALSREPLARRFVESARKWHEQSAQNISRTPKTRQGLRPIELSVVLTGIMNGLLFQHACYPDIVTEKIVTDVLLSLVR
jgi:AcrR family transcriptional regulator